jgi:hypothetical protein
LLEDKINRLVVVIENKIGSTEHSGQLQKYLGQIAAEYPEPEWRLIAVYLTPDGEVPSEAAYLPADYGIIAAVVEAVAESRRPTIDPAVYALLIHYAQMLRRHVVENSEIAELCRRIYQRHRRAIDLIFEHRPDRLAEIESILVDLVNSQDDLILDTESKRNVFFAHVDLEKLPRGTGWTRSGRIVLFQFVNDANFLDLVLYVGPGMPEVRKHLIDTAMALPAPFRVPQPKLREGEKWKQIYSLRFANAEDLQELPIEALETHLRARWNDFVTRDLDKLMGPLSEAAKSLETQLDKGVPSAT